MTVFSTKALAIFSTALMISTPAFAGKAVTLAKDDSAFLAYDAPSLYPEGIETHPTTGEFILGSIRKGKVVAISPEGKVRDLIQDERLRSAVGIRVDAERGRLLVNNSDYGVAERSAPSDKFDTVALAIYDLETGEPLHYVDLSGLRPDEKRFANDLTVDEDGNAYVTDSLAAAIYKVTPDGQASVFLTNERFRGEGFNLNGIQTHPDGYLLVAKKSDGSLFKVPLDAPENFSEVKLPKALIGTDGLVLADANTLVAITNVASGVQSDTIFKLTTNDDWESAKIADTFDTGNVYATTGTLRDGKIFVSYGRLNTLGGSLKGETPLLDSFRIQEIGSK